MIRERRFAPFVAVVIGIATFSAMDAAMKSAALQTGVYTALLLRNAGGTLLILPAWLATSRRLPSPTVLRVHLQRSAVTACMAALFFYGLVRIPMAEGIAISFIAPLVALYFAAAMLGETIRPGAILASLLGIAGVIVIAAGRFGAGELDRETALGTAAILVSALFYAVNLVLQRKQALLAGPVEVTLFQNLLTALILLGFAPWLLVWPDAAALRAILAGAVLATLALLFLAWGYARAEAQALMPIEYSGFLWAALFGWLLFGERIDTGTVAGAVLIVAGCALAARSRPEKHLEHVIA
ncbi:DMT family transporter [Novosphingobium sp. H3SJ31-1]|uniref:DMT family transporter n=2 Tax=Novosphingobium album (ex Liu et al. 2023) TaxID=3031130 RepID=A0ABT5WL28_9SPHN|nr:DMT family transporter [Novosphingobium album (ex Liu et al. 2023)]MDE8650745.1 DMT family transporter [Novosphingobium album (ex Liu et al. 2023)]